MRKVPNFAATTSNIVLYAFRYGFNFSLLAIRAPELQTTYLQRDSLEGYKKATLLKL